jgi:hypothetical protein
VYAPLVVELANGQYLSCSPGEIVLLAAKPATGRAEQFRDERGRTPHKRRVADILVPAGGEPEVLVLLDEGFVLSHYHLPGGSHFWFEQADVSELDEMYTSSISGRTASLRDFVKAA